MLQSSIHPSLAFDHSAKRDGIEAELITILQSAQFRNSKRSCAFLRYIVEQAIDGNTSALKEHGIGATVFGRGRGYNPSNDAFVRVRANDVRRRLAEYYESNQPKANVRICLAPGSYIPLFKTIASSIENRLWDSLVANRSVIEITIQPSSIALVNAAWPLSEAASRLHLPLRFVAPGAKHASNALEIYLEILPGQTKSHVGINAQQAPQCRITSGNADSIFATLTQLCSPEKPKSQSAS